MRRRRFITGLVGAGAGLGLTSASARAATVGGDRSTGPRTTGAGRTHAGTTGGVRSATAGEPHVWQTVPAPGGTPAAQLIGVAAAGPDLAWAVGEEGRNGGTAGTPLALVWDGTTWTRAGLAHLGLTGGLRSVAADPTGRAWAVGSGAHLLSWDGTTWQEAGFPGRGTSGTTLTGVATDADGGVWLSGRNGAGSVLLHGADGAWSWIAPPPSGTTVTPSGVRVTVHGDVWVYDSALVARWDGSAWTELPAPGGLRPAVTGLLPVTADDIWLTGYDYGVGGPPGKPPGVTLKHWDGTAWNSVTAPFTAGMLTAIVDDGQGGPDRIAGWDFWDQTRAHYLRWQDGGWVSERGATATTPVLPEALAAVPGTGGYWSVGTTSFSPYPPAQVYIER
ncbi:hypothetical protein [Streptomyces sp. MBT33]|uniref:hypothetical protein n=1 Tax=Streptomyces sp. MBT33 TaxID=1488363 RepID=UPI00190B59AA|nr:hypothetical protein [Streptomyces sp. MBT33]MBK3644521.1 hypothetical protein [Streptomyces sp. MBT33]